MSAVAEKPRDLDADLAICEAATPDLLSNNEVFLNSYLKVAYNAWPYVIRRAMEAEQEIDRLRNELNILQEQQQRAGGCWD